MALGDSYLTFLNLFCREKNENLVHTGTVVTNIPDHT